MLTLRETRLLLLLGQSQHPTCTVIQPVVDDLIPGVSRNNNPCSSPSLVL